MSKAKTASKNNPTARQQAKEFTFEGKKIKPAKFISVCGRTYLAAEYDNGALVLDASGVPLPWNKVAS